MLCGNSRKCFRFYRCRRKNEILFGFVFFLYFIVVVVVGFFCAVFTSESLDFISCFKYDIKIINNIYDYTQFLSRITIENLWMSSLEQNLARLGNVAAILLTPFEAHSVAESDVNSPILWHSQRLRKFVWQNEMTWSNHEWLEDDFW